MGVDIEAVVIVRRENPCRNGLYVLDEVIGLLCGEYQGFDGRDPCSGLVALEGGLERHAGAFGWSESTGSRRCVG